MFYFSINSCIYTSHDLITNLYQIMVLWGSSTITSQSYHWGLLLLILNLYNPQAVQKTYIYHNYIYALFITSVPQSGWMVNFWRCHDVHDRNSSELLIFGNEVWMRSRKGTIYLYLMLAIEHCVLSSCGEGGYWLGGVGHCFAWQGTRPCVNCSSIMSNFIWQS